MKTLTIILTILAGAGIVIMITLAILEQATRELGTVCNY